MRSSQHGSWRKAGGGGGAERERARARLLDGEHVWMRDRERGDARARPRRPTLPPCPVEAEMRK